MEVTVTEVNNQKVANVLPRVTSIICHFLMIFSGFFDKSPGENFGKRRFLLFLFY